MIENLWAGWRGEYLSSLPESNPESNPGASVFARILDSGLSDEETYIVHRSTNVFVILNAYPYSVGHTLVLPYRQVADLVDLTAEETTELWNTVSVVCRAVRREYAPHGINVGINMGAASGGSVNEHLHVHVVPRWHGDSNFLTTTANAKAIPEALDVTAARLRSALSDSDSLTDPASTDHHP
jgi:ATP adenylyltransferase